MEPLKEETLSLCCTAVSMITVAPSEMTMILQAAGQGVITSLHLVCEVLTGYFVQRFLLLNLTDLKHCCAQEKIFSKDINLVYLDLLTQKMQ